MLTCRKLYSDIPFAHRQWRHDGHCAFIHGHNWGIAVTFACTQTDANGFVVDFGKLGFLKAWIADHLDHACVLATDDPLKKALTQAAPEAWKILEVPSPSSEGLAQFFYAQFDPLVREATAHRAWVQAVEVFEDSRNSALYVPQPETDNR
ncbi:MAG: 6-pyruvoyl tetrahydropterin synthase family protein [Opitutales bacterium]